jgi:hypothetical protein
LKPDCVPSSTEVDLVQRHRTLENVRCNLVRMIKPNLIFSHDWHVQPNCQRSLRAIHLSGALWGSRPRLLRRGVLELVALAEVMHLYRLRRFCANLLKLSKFNLHVKLNLSISREESNPTQAIRTAQNIKQRPAKNARAAKARRRQETPGYCNGFVLSRDSLQGFRGTCRA